MAISAYAQTNTMGSIALEDGTAMTPVTLTLSYDRGDVAVDIPSGDKLNEYVKIERRGKFVSVAHGARVYPTISFSVIVTSLTGSSAPGSAVDFMRRTASSAYDGNVSTLGSGTDMPYAFNVTLTVENSDFDSVADDTIVCNDCILTSCNFAEGEPNVLTFSCEVLGAITGGIDGEEIS